jgi:hypothetical protein
MVLLYEIVDLELEVWSTSKGWVGERSVASTEAEGYWSAKSMAQIPVPVPLQGYQVCR